jgi:hypothetical protein
MIANNHPWFMTSPVGNPLGNYWVKDCKGCKVAKFWSDEILPTIRSWGRIWE